MQGLQQCAPLPTVGVGRAMTAALLLASHLKDQQEVGLFFKGDGPLGSFYAHANHLGQVRGFCANPHFWPETPCSLGLALGKGFLTVTHHIPFQKEPYQGTVELVSGEVGEDIASYLHNSRQIQSLIRVGVSIADTQIVSTAGGLLIEMMPGAEEEIIDRLLANNERLSKEPGNRLSDWISKGISANDVVSLYLDGIPFRELEHSYEPQYFCPCTIDRVESALLLLGSEELEEVVDEGLGIDVSCQMCGRPYHVKSEKIVEILSSNNLRKQGLH